MSDFKKLTAYKKAHELAMEIFEVSKSFPKEERFSLTDQIRRSSRSVCANIAEAYRKRQYKAHFISKTSDADMENSETLVWLDFAMDCKYLATDTKTVLAIKNEEIGKLLHHMINFPDKYQTSEMKFKSAIDSKQRN
jgi:four helix bundle protein